MTFVLEPREISSWWEFCSTYSKDGRVKSNQTWNDTLQSNLNSRPTKDASCGEIYSHCSTAWKRSCATRTARGSPRDQKNEIIGQNVCVCGGLESMQCGGLESVQIVEKELKVTSGSITTRLAKALFTYRIPPQGTTGISPAKLMPGRLKAKNQTRSTQSSHCGEGGSKAATTEDKAWCYSQLSL